METDSSDKKSYPVSSTLRTLLEKHFHIVSADLSEKRISSFLFDLEINGWKIFPYEYLNEDS